ncbi:MAG: DUF1810 domain-containing protein [Methanospirillum sp.]|nr:DUF1810 domain-containing protein [Methanospirillum sp.]
MQKRYRETLDDLVARGLFDDEPVPNSLAINSYLVLQGADDGSTDPYDLERFVQAQRPVYQQALSELRAGRKRSHWMWYIFPQLAGLGRSPTSREFSIRTLAEAEAYLRHPVLGPRLVECAEAVLAVEGRPALEIFGSPDDRKLRSCATLFALVSPPGSVFHRLLDRYFQGEPDARTPALLGLDGGRGR